MFDGEKAGVVGTMQTSAGLNLDRLRSDPATEVTLSNNETRPITEAPQHIINAFCRQGDTRIHPAAERVAAICIDRCVMGAGQNLAASLGMKTASRFIISRETGGGPPSLN